MNNKQLQLAKDIKSEFFATRDTVMDAFQYAYQMIDSLPQEAKAPAYTALHVVINTIAHEIIKNENNLTVLATEEDN